MRGGLPLFSLLSVSLLHLPSTIYLSMSTFASSRTRHLVVVGILSSHLCLFSFACYYHCYTRRSDTPCFYSCTFYCCLCLSLFSFVVVFSLLCTSSVPIRQGVPLLFTILVSLLSLDTCGLRPNSHHLFIHLHRICGSHYLGKITLHRSSHFVAGSPE